jgi:hypothetical protein
MKKFEDIMFYLVACGLLIGGLMIIALFLWVR